MCIHHKNYKDSCPFVDKGRFRTNVYVVMTVCVHDVCSYSANELRNHPLRIVCIYRGWAVCGEMWIRGSGIDVCNIVVFIQANFKAVSMLQLLIVCM